MTGGCTYSDWLYAVAYARAKLEGVPPAERDARACELAREWADRPVSIPAPAKPT